MCVFGLRDAFVSYMLRKMIILWLKDTLDLCLGDADLLYVYL